MLSPETILQGRYRIGRQLGQGGMGAVYEAIDQRLDTIVALKETLFTDERLRKQFEREARLLARLHHQALPRVSDHFSEGDGQYLVMQYIPGEDLFEMQAQRNGPFPQADVLRWADQLCDALDYLHTQDPQIIHRDIKPQNLKLTARGQIILLDFGLAKGSAGPMSIVTTSASIFGYTPNYAPLEQVQGLGTDARSDIYSLAATLYHLLTNVKPPDALSRAGALINGEPDPLALASAVSTQVSPAVAAVLAKGMSQKRDDRYASASEMREAMCAASTQPLGEAATFLSSGMTTKPMSSAPATQVNAQRTSGFGNEAQTLLAHDATKVRSQAGSTETPTVVRPSSSTRKPAMWLAATILLILIVGSVGAFYVYRARRSQSAQNEPTAQNPAPPVPTQAPLKVSETPTQPLVTESSAAKTRVETGNQRSRKPAQAIAAKSTPAQSSERETALRDPNRNSERSQNPQPPLLDPNHSPPPNRTLPRPRPADQPGILNLPNGARVETRPDGTRIITLRNGATHVIPPGEMPNRRRRRP